LEYVHVALLGISGRSEYIFNIKGSYLKKKTDDSSRPALKDMKGTDSEATLSSENQASKLHAQTTCFFLQNPAETWQKHFREANMQNICYLCNVCNGSPLLSLISSQFAYKRDIVSLGGFISPKHCQAC